MNTGMEKMLESIEWAEGNTEREPNEDGLPWATHSGVLEIPGHRLRCSRLNTGQIVFLAEDVEKFFEGMNP